jgi:hypothetical protein
MPTQRQWRSNRWRFLLVVEWLGRVVARRFATTRSVQQRVERPLEKNPKIESRAIGQPNRLVSQDELLIGRFADGNVQGVLSFGTLNHPAFGRVRYINDVMNRTGRRFSGVHARMVTPAFCGSPKALRRGFATVVTRDDLRLRGALADPQCPPSSMDLRRGDSIEQHDGHGLAVGSARVVGLGISMAEVPPRTERAHSSARILCSSNDRS